MFVLNAGTLWLLAATRSASIFQVRILNSKLFKSRALEGLKQKDHRYVDRWQYLCILSMVPSI